MSDRDRDPLVEDGVFAGNYSDKHETRNPIARALVDSFHRHVRELVARTGASDVHEVGCGEGYLTAQLAAPGRRLRGTDFSAQVIEIARRRAEETGLEARFEACSVYDLDPERHAAELVVCCEVFEHLEDPERARDVLADLARGWLLASVPREPLWRALNFARGKYWSAFGNTPGHLQHWSRPGFLRFLAERFEVAEVRSPVPWTIALCRARSHS